jgi:hypothetical protein
MRPNGGGIGRANPTHGRLKDLDTPKDTEVGVLDGLPLPTTSKGGGGKSKIASSEDRRKKSKGLKHGRREKPRVHVDRRPPTVPILLPEHRYCGLDEIVKPYRTHHCRSCGTVRFVWLFEMIPLQLTGFSWLLVCFEV